MKKTESGSTSGITQLDYIVILCFSDILTYVKNIKKINKTDFYKWQYKISEL